MKKFFKYNRVAAICALVLIVLLCIFGGVNRTVYSYKNKAEKLYPIYDMSDATDLTKFKEFAVKLSAIAKSNGCYTLELDGYIAELATDYPFVNNNYAILKITSSSAAVYNELVSKSNVDEQQLRSAKSYYYEMDSILTRLRNSSENSEYVKSVEKYNKAAEKYNKAKNTFPANILTWYLPDASVLDK